MNRVHLSSLLGTRRHFSVSPLATAAVLAAAGCAQLEANRHVAGVITNDAFTPVRPAAVNYGPDPTRNCPAGGATKITVDVLDSQAKKQNKPAPKLDGRLCAMADTLLGWDRPEPPSQNVLDFLSSYFGMESPVRRHAITVLHTEDPRLVADGLPVTISGFADGATAPAFGLATERVRKGETRVVLLMRDARVEIDPVPRALPLKGTTVLSGRLLGELQNPKILFSDPGGKLQTVKIPPGKEFRADLACGERPGLLLVEIRAEEGGAETDLADFPIACGTDLSASIAVKPPAQGPLEAAAEEKKVFDLINAARGVAGVGALASDPAVVAVARSISEAISAHNSTPDIIAALRQAEVMSPVVTENGGAARSGEEVQAHFALNPSLRANYLSSDVSHGGVGVALTTGPDGKPSVIVTELFVRELPVVDAEDVRGKVREALARKRADARAPALEPDATLDQVATAYAKELAATRGKPTKERVDAILSPLNSAFLTVNTLLAAKDKAPVDMAEDGLVVSGGNFAGVGIAQGTHPVYGKNAIFAVVLVGKKRTEADSHPRRKKH